MRVRSSWRCSFQCFPLSANGLQRLRMCTCVCAFFLTNELMIIADLLFQKFPSAPPTTQPSA